MELAAKNMNRNKRIFLIRYFFFLPLNAVALKDSIIAVAAAAAVVVDLSCCRKGTVYFGRHPRRLSIAVKRASWPNRWVASDWLAAVLRQGRTRP